MELFEVPVVKMRKKNTKYFVGTKVIIKGQMTYPTIIFYKDRV